jgi:hypothetical protein
MLLTLPKLAIAGYTVYLRDKEESTETAVGVRNTRGVWMSWIVKTNIISYDNHKRLFNFGEEL